MDYWIHTAGVPFADMVDLAGAADELGYRGLLFSEHLVEPPAEADTRGRYPYNPDGLQSGLEYPDPWVLAAALSQIADRLEFATAVAVLPLHETFALARSVATASILSAGRVSLGIGTGWLDEEFTAVGRDFATRGARTDAMVGDLRQLWSGESIKTPAGPARMPEPLPGRIRILVGGHSSPALARAVQCDGWIGAAGHLAVDDLCAVAADLVARRRDTGANVDRFDVIDRPRGPITPDVVTTLGEAGVTGVIAFAGRRWRERLAGFAADVMGRR